MIQAVPELLKPLYSLKAYNERRYKVIKYRRSDGFLWRAEPSDPVHYDNKLENSLSRTKSRIIELGLCNEWQFFFTGTLDDAKINRYDLKGFRSVLSQWIRDRRKAYESKIQYLLVPEFHKDGAIHVHGFVSGIPYSQLTSFDVIGLSQPVPVRLLNHGFYRWNDFDKRFGFCSLAPIRDLDAASFYISKYITKDFIQRSADLNSHLFWASQGLMSAVPIGESYVPSSYLDSFLTANFDFCSSGWVTQSKVSDLDWTFDGEGNIQFPSLEQLDYPDQEIFDAELFSYENVIIAGWCNGNT